MVSQLHVGLGFVFGCEMTPRLHKLGFSFENFSSKLFKNSSLVILRECDL